MHAGPLGSRSALNVRTVSHSTRMTSVPLTHSPPHNLEVVMNVVVPALITPWSHSVLTNFQATTTTNMTPTPPSQTSLSPSSHMPTHTMSTNLRTTAKKSFLFTSPDWSSSGGSATSFSNSAPQLGSTCGLCYSIAREIVVICDVTTTTLWTEMEGGLFDNHCLCGVAVIDFDFEGGTAGRSA